MGGVVIATFSCVEGLQMRPGWVAAAMRPCPDRRFCTCEPPCPSPDSDSDADPPSPDLRLQAKETQSRNALAVANSKNDRLEADG